MTRERRGTFRRIPRTDPGEEPHLRVAAAAATEEDILRRENSDLREALLVTTRYLRRALLCVRGEERRYIEEDITREGAIVKVGGLPDDKL